MKKKKEQKTLLTSSSMKGAATTEFAKRMHAMDACERKSSEWYKKHKYDADYWLHVIGCHKIIAEADEHFSFVMLMSEIAEFGKRIKDGEFAVTRVK